MNPLPKLGTQPSPPSLAACVCAAAFLLHGCAGNTLVARDAAQSQHEASSAHVANLVQDLEVQGRHGRLDQAQRSRLLQSIDAQGPGNSLQRHLAAQQQYEPLALYAGGAARLLIDGPATFEAMFAAIRQARRTVLLESYIIEDADVALRLAGLLKQKRLEGVQVAVLYDSVGSIGTDPAYFQGLQAAGVATCAFNPLVSKRRIAYWNLAHRDHRKILVVDGEQAFTGGINISAVYHSGSGSFSRSRSKTRPAPNEAQDPNAKGWRDTQVQLSGPAAEALDALVRETWAHQGCQPVLPAQGPAGTAATSARTAPPAPIIQQLVAVLPSSPLDDYNRIYAMLLTAIDVSQHSVWFTMAYFAPGADMIEALCDAARRGVDVRLLLPSQSDFSPVFHAGRSHYTRLLQAGVKLYELQGTVLHAKTAVIDGVLSTVGSSNLDWRSLADNNEVNAVVFGENFGQAMHRMFERDLQACQSITAQAWARRSWWQRSKEAAAGLLARFW